MILIMQNRMMRLAGTAVATGIALAALGIPGATHASVVHLPAATAYVANARSDTVTPIDIATGVRGAAITVHGGPAQIAVTPGGTTAYVASQNHGLVTPIDTRTDYTDAGSGMHDSTLTMTRETLANNVCGSVEASPSMSTCSSSPWCARRIRRSFRFCGAW